MGKRKRTRERTLPKNSGHLQKISIKKGFRRNPRGIFRTKSWVNFAGDFLDFFGPFSLEETGGKTGPKNPRQNSNQNLGVLQPKSTLQGSALEKMGVCQRSGEGIVKRECSSKRVFLESPFLLCPGKVFMCFKGKP